MTSKTPFLDGGGEATRLILERDWSQHPLGPPDRWPTGLRTALSLILNSPESMILAWGPDLHFFFNETYIPLLGPRVSWAMGERFDKVWEDGWDQARPIIEEAFEGRSRRFEDLPWKLATDRGSSDTWWSFSYSRILNDEGGIAGLFIFTNETTKRVLGERARRSLHETLEERMEEAILQRKLWADVFETTNSLVAAVDLDYALLALNRAFADEFETIYGVRPKIGDRVFDLLEAPEHRDAVRGVWERALAGEEFVVVQEFGDPGRMRGSYEVKFHPLRNASGQRIGAFLYGQDVSERLRSQKELQDAQDALRQAQKMEAVGQLTGGIAHDFNNLLTGITGSLDLMLTRIQKGRINDVERYVTVAQGAAKRAAALTHRLLAFSRRQTLAPQPTDVNRLIAGMEELLRRTVGPGIQVDIVGAGGLWGTLVDPHQLENSVLNLVINARDAMPDGGRITIETANKWFDDRTAKERELAPGQYLSVCVTDTGTGMSPAVVERAFEPFYTTKPLGQGTGLGLSMIYGFTRQSGGQVRIYSELGQGTTICLYLPRHHGEDVAPAEEIRRSDPHRAEAGQTVMVVDDEPTVRMLVMEVLEESGYAAIEAADGPSAMKVLGSNARIDLLITDVGLPGGMNGRQVADAARLVRPDLKVMFITGYAENAVVGNGQIEPGMSVVTKPFDVAALENKIREMLAD